MTMSSTASEQPTLPAGIGESEIVINRPMEGEFYVLEVDYGDSGRGHGVVFENDDTAPAPPYGLPRERGTGFPPFKEMPRLRHTRPRDTVDDLDSSFGGYWLVSEPLKQVLELVDPKGFAFAPCDFILYDGSQGPPHYLCDVSRVLNAVDEATSKVRIKTSETAKHGRYYSLQGGAKLAFKKDVVGSAHVFRTPYSSQLVICDRVLRDALIENGFGKSPKRRGVLLTDAANC